MYYFPETRLAGAVEATMAYIAKSAGETLGMSEFIRCGRWEAHRMAEKCLNSGGEKSKEAAPSSRIAETDHDVPL